jgi:drug/metabolite transporter (DMT)-like permease
LRNVLKRIDHNVVSFWVFFFGALSFFPFMLREFQSWSLNQVNGAGLTGILYGIFGSSLLGYGLFHYGIRKIKLQEVGIFTYVEPVAAVIMAFFLTHEYLTFFDIVGGALIALGIFISQEKLYQHKLHHHS